MTASFQKLRNTLLPALFLFSLVATFIFFLYYPDAGKLVMPVLAVIWLGSPVITLFTCLVFIFSTRPAAFVFVKIWTAFYASLVLIGCATFQDNANPASLIGGMVLGVMALILIIMMMTLAVKNYRHRKKPGGLSSRWLFRDIFFSIIGGWIFGILFWSITTPAMIIAAAEKTAADNIYCVRAHNRPVRSLLDLTALRFYSLSYRWRDMGDRHGTMTVFINSDRHHRNKANVTYRYFFYWSYRLRAFVPDGRYVGPSGNEGDCFPQRDFAKNLPLF